MRDFKQGLPDLIYSLGKSLVVGGRASWEGESRSGGGQSGGSVLFQGRCVYRGARAREGAQEGEESRAQVRPPGRTVVSLLR